MEFFYEQKLNYEEVKALLENSGTLFTPPPYYLYSTQKLEEYSKKLSDFAYFILGKENDNVICFIAYYKNLQNMQFYVSLLCVQEKFQRNGLGHKMMEILSKNKDFSSIGLEVNKVNTKAYNFYIKENFKIKEDRTDKFLMEKLI